MKMMLKMMLAFIAFSFFMTNLVAQGRVFTNPIIAKKQKAFKKNPKPVNKSIPNRLNLPDHLRPAFENVPVWRLQLIVKTGNREHANTDSEVYVQFNNYGGKYFLDKGGNDRERKRTDVYEILNPAIKTIRDIKYLRLAMGGNDGWCIEKIELKVNGAPYPIFRKTYKGCQWIDRDDKKYQASLYISGRRLRNATTWKHFQGNRAIWLPPTLIKRYTLEKMVECYMGHLMNSEPQMKKLEFGKKSGRAYVEAKKTRGNKLHFDLDLVYDWKIDLETDVDFNLAVYCRNNKINLKAESVKAKVNVPVLTSLIRVFKSRFAKMDMGNFDFGNANVPFCPTIRVENNGNISLRL